MGERKSRMQRNSVLHEQLLAQKEGRIETKELSPFANQLNKIDSQFERMDLKQEVDTNYKSPLHVRNDRFSPKQQLDQSIVNPSETEDANLVPQQVTTDFENDYLEDFIKEVKQYNVDMGYRQTVDTKANVLSSIDGFQTHVRPFGDPPFILRSLDEEIDNLDKSLPVDVEIVEDMPIDLEETITFVPELEEEVEEVEPEVPQDTIMMEVRRLSELEHTDDSFTELEDVTEELVTKESKVEDDDLDETQTGISDKLFNFLMTLLVSATLLLVIYILYVIITDRF